MRRAERIVLFRRHFGRPWMFLHGVGRHPQPTPLEMRTTVINAGTQVTRSVVPPNGLVVVDTSAETYVLQGTVEDLHRFADHVQVR